MQASPERSSQQDLDRGDMLRRGERTRTLERSTPYISNPRNLRFGRGELLSGGISEEHSDTEDDIERGNNHDTQEVTSQRDNQSIRKKLSSWRLKGQLVLPHEEELSLRLQENNANGVNLEDTQQE